MVWWTVEDEIADPTDFIPVTTNEGEEQRLEKPMTEVFVSEGEPPEEVEPLADEQE